MLHFIFIKGIVEQLKALEITRKKEYASPISVNTHPTIDEKPD